MKRFKRHITFILFMTICFSFIHTNKVYAYSLSASPSHLTTNKDVTKISLPTLPVDCYVLYTSRESDTPSQSQMWRIPANYPNIQDYNICGTWYLHVYVPSTGDRATFGPYQKEITPPIVPVFQCKTTGVWEGKWASDPTLTYASFDVATQGDQGNSERDTINNTDSYFQSGVDYIEVWDTLNGVDKLLGKVNASSTSFTVQGIGWHKLWAKAVDKVGNESDWGIYEFGLGPEGEIPDPEEPDIPSGKLGVIKFNPNETKWTNKGKTGEGEGAYPVEVYYTGDNPYKTKGTATIEKEKTDDEGNTTTVTSKKSITVEFPLEYIEVTGDAEDTVDGDRGMVYIEQEGEGQSLHGEGFWGDAEYDEPSDCVDVDYDEPDNPVGDSGKYDIDWTRPEFTVSPKPKKEWRNDTLYDVDVEIYDELSGIDTGTIELDDISHYQRDETINVNGGGNHDFSHTFELDDGIYSIGIDAVDIATNDYQKTYKTYYVDGTEPEIDFNIKEQIFSEDAGAIRKPSILGYDDSFYGKLTCTDNLSGVKSIQYKWTYGNKKPTNGYTRIYTSQDTYYDRYQEVEINEIEKPVGDNLYLHVEVYDVAGNYKYECFGPYEDPIKLVDFQITDIRDPRWIDVFWNDTLYQDYKNFSYKVNQMPIDEETHPTLRNALPKKGYAFYFDITSEYLYREYDRIEITPTFYYIDGIKRIRADAYYSNYNNPLVKFGSLLDDSEIYIDTERYGNVLIGGYNKLTLTKGVRICKGREWLGDNGWKDEIQYRDGKIQWWYGKYFIPSSTFFVKAGDKPLPMNRLVNGDILINFEIIAYKNGVETLSISQIYNYTKQRWEVEGGPKNNKYLIGDVIMHNAKYGVNSDKNISVIH